MLGKTLFVFTTFLLLGSFAHAQMPPPPPKPTPPPRSGGSRFGADDKSPKVTVRGRAFYEDTGRPIRNGLIGLKRLRDLPKPDDKSKNDGPMLMVAGGRYGASEYSLTNENGEFEIKNVSAGIYEPYFKVQGVLNSGDFFSAKDSSLEVIVDGANDLQINVAAKRGSAITGRVTYADGDPAVGVRVIALLKREARFFASRSQYGESGLGETTTDDRGIYRFSGLPPGDYLIKVIENVPMAEKEFGRYEQGLSRLTSMLQTFYPASLAPEKATLINLAQGEEQTSIDITLPERKLSSLSGKIVFKGNMKPLEKVKVTISKKQKDFFVVGDSSGNEETVYTDAQGAFNFKNLPAGDFTLQVSVSNNWDFYGDAEARKVIESQPKFSPVVKEVVVENKDLSGFLIEMPSEASIAGSIIIEGDAPFHEAYLNAINTTTKKGKGTFLSKTKDKDGIEQPLTFELGGLIEGTHYLTASGGAFYTKSIKLDGKEIAGLPLEIKEGDQLKNLKITLASDSGILNGRVENYDPKNRVILVFLPAKYAPSIRRLLSTELVPDQTGNFKHHLAPGEYYWFSYFLSEIKGQTQETLDNWVADRIKTGQKFEIKAKETTTLTLEIPK